MAKPTKANIRIARTKAATASAEFAAAHRRGMASLKRRDYDSLGKAIEAEAIAIDKMADAVDAVATKATGRKHKR